MRFFNTEGPIISEDNYFIPPLERLDSELVFDRIDRKRFFVLHAPRQTGKTTSLLSLRDEVNRSGRYRCVYANFEGGQAAREDVKAAMEVILGELADEVQDTLDDSFIEENYIVYLEKYGPHNALERLFNKWAVRSDKPLVVLIDEIDALIGDTLISVLRQLRSGYPERPKYFPQTVVLCGVRDVRDYSIRSGSEKDIITGGSVFNVKAKSMRLRDFSHKETKALLEQHTHETGQQWSEGSIEEVWRLTQGQPWLVNSLASRACLAVSNPDQPIELNAIDDAREQMILDRESHLDQLAEKLKEQRVRRVIEPVLSGDLDSEDIPDDDTEYVEDLGLIKIDNGIRIANPIYQEVIPRVLTRSTQLRFPQDPAWFIDEGMLRVDKLLAEFQRFFQMHSEHWVKRFKYEEAGTQLLLQAFLQRIVNSDGRIEREYGLGRRRTDLLIIWPGENGDVKTVIECKILHGSLDSTIKKGLEQTYAYMDRCSAEQGHLVIFDQSEGKTWKEKIFRRSETVNGASITVWGM